MVIYEITAVVEPSLVSQYEQYMLTRHIPNLLATGYFTGASLARSEPGRYRVRYEAATREALDRYLSEHAPRLRADFDAHFPTGVQLTREVWETVQVWSDNR